MESRVVRIGRVALAELLTNNPTFFVLSLRLIYLPVLCSYTLQRNWINNI